MERLMILKEQIGMAEVFLHPKHEACKELGCIPYETEFEDGTPVSMYEEDSLSIHERDLYVTHI